MRFFIFVFSLFLSTSLSQKSIWFLRHCDKPHNPVNPCCTDLGYDRANHWYRYFADRIKHNQPLAIYTSGFNEKRVCINNTRHLSTKYCQKSQRMYLTALAIQREIPQSILHSSYCVGDYRRLLRDIRLSTLQNIIVVWEHNEIIQMIRDYGVDISKWRNRFNNHYDIVFHLVIQNKKVDFTYDLYDFANNMVGHKREVDAWLDPHHKSTNSPEKSTAASSSVSSRSSPNVYVMLLLMFAICLITISFCCHICHLAMLRGQRREYIQV